ncbi:hypothetical protein C3L33_23444, partial [Rhododendron williamsianum]
MAVSRWSVDTHTFEWAWGESGPTLEDTFALMRLHPRGLRLLDLDNLSSDETFDMQALYAAFAEAKRAGWRFKADGTHRPPPNPRKGGIGFLEYFLSNFVLPNFPSKSVSPFAFPLAACLTHGEAVALGPFFLGCLFNHLEQVHTDMERSLGLYDMISMIHLSFLLAFFFEHYPAIAPPQSTAPARGRRRFLIERWSCASSRALLSSYCDRSVHFLPSPYLVHLDGMIDNTDFLLPMRLLLSTTGLLDELARAVINSYCISLPGWLPSFLQKVRAQSYTARTESPSSGLIAGHEDTLLPFYDARHWCLYHRFPFVLAEETELLPSVCPRKHPRAPGVRHGEIGTRVHYGEVQVEEITVEEAARNAKKQPIEEERVLTPREVIRNFPAGHVDEECFPLLNSIALVHPETFTNFSCRAEARGPREDLRASRQARIRAKASG